MFNKLDLSKYVKPTTDEELRDLCKALITEVFNEDLSKIDLNRIKFGKLRGSDGITVGTLREDGYEFDYITIHENCIKAEKFLDKYWIDVIVHELLHWYVDKNYPEESRSNSRHEGRFEEYADELGLDIFWDNKRRASSGLTYDGKHAAICANCGRVLATSTNKAKLWEVVVYGIPHSGRWLLCTCGYRTVVVKNSHSDLRWISYKKAVVWADVELCKRGGVDIDPTNMRRVISLPTHSPTLDKSITDYWTEVGRRKLKNLK